jgi:putative transposase
MQPGGKNALIVENIHLKQQLNVCARKYKRAPKLTRIDRLIFGALTSLLNPNKINKIGIIVKPATLIKFHKALVKRKYRLLYAAKSHRKPGPTGPSKELINIIVEIKKRNPRFGALRIAMQINNAFGLEINKDTVLRVLAKYYRSSPNGNGPSWLHFIGNIKDSLWSIDFFRVESIHLKSHWVMLIMDQFTRRIISCAVHQGNLDGITACCMFNRIIKQTPLPKYLSSDNDPVFCYHRWKANLSILDIKEIKSIPYTPTSHPFLERLIGTIRREHLDHTLFWNERDLLRKLNQFKEFYNQNRAHSSLNNQTPNQANDIFNNNILPLQQFKWKTHCNRLFQLPVAA